MTENMKNVPQDVWEKKDLRSSKLSIIGKILEVYRPINWSEKEEELADRILAYVYHSKGDRVNKMIQDYEAEQSPF